ncbi:hypothetical protein H6G81_35155 [Scytonema hofmannii FACHB-248]|uniref:Uncharacterized protein n=1 Tax=Scytonema hofmannii FACHB-248 TaxID=1842502 RepID=A0ABR8H2W4_9CYAN|nr:MULTISPECIES: hypothetical protein [Nostocales]MBD2609591.1 hypothetical protein [Scytonema hofmannii FACHB-248]
MKIKNGTTQDASGRRKNSKRKNEPVRLGEYGQDSPTEGTEQIGNAALDSTGKDTAWSDNQRKVNPGKILERLELIEKTFLSYVQGHQHRLEMRLDESKTIETVFKGEVAALKQEIYHLTSDIPEDHTE